MRKLGVLLVLAVAVCGTSANAATFGDSADSSSGIYIGATAGKQELTPSNLDSKMEFSGILGYQINDFLSVEGTASYTDYDTILIAGRDSSFVANMSTVVLTIAPKVRIDLFGNLDVFAKLGYSSAYVELEDPNGNSHIKSRNETDLYYAAGLEYNFTSQSSVLLAYNKYNSTMDSINVGVTHRF